MNPMEFLALSSISPYNLPHSNNRDSRCNVSASCSSVIPFCTVLFILRLHTAFHCLSVPSVSKHCSQDCFQHLFPSLFVTRAVQKKKKEKDKNINLLFD